MVLWKFIAFPIHGFLPEPHLEVSPNPYFV